MLTIQGLVQVVVVSMRAVSARGVLVHLPGAGCGAGGLQGPEWNPASGARHQAHRKRARMVRCVRGLRVWPHRLQASEGRAARGDGDSHRGWGPRVQPVR